MVGFDYFGGGGSSLLCCASLPTPRGSHSAQHRRQRIVVAHNLGQHNPERRGHRAQNNAHPAQVDAPRCREDAADEQRLNDVRGTASGHQALDGALELGVDDRPHLVALHVDDHQREQAEQG